MALLNFVSKQLLDEVFVISGITKIEVSVINRSRANLIIFLLYFVLKKDKRTVEEANRREIILLSRVQGTYYIPPVNLTVSWKARIARATYKLFTNLLAD